MYQKYRDGNMYCKKIACSIYDIPQLKSCGVCVPYIERFSHQILCVNACIKNYFAVLLDTNT